MYTLDRLTTTASLPSLLVVVILCIGSVTSSSVSSSSVTSSSVTTTTSSDDVIARHRRGLEDAMALLASRTADVSTKLPNYAQPDENIGMLNSKARLLYLIIGWLGLLDNLLVLVVLSSNSRDRYAFSNVLIMNQSLIVSLLTNLII